MAETFESPPATTERWMSHSLREIRNSASCHPPTSCYVAVLCGIFAGLALSQQTQQNTVEGVVLLSGTNEPLPDVSVQLSRGRSEAYEVQTGNDGRFQFRNIPTELHARCGPQRVCPADYGRRRLSDPPLMLVAGPNGPSQH